MLKLLWELVVKDLKIFVSDRKAMLISFAVPVVIASFMGMITGSMGGSDPAKPANKIPIVVVNEDSGAVATEVMAVLGKSEALAVRTMTRDEAKKLVDRGKAGFALVLPKGFGQKALAAMDGGASPEIVTMADPTKNIEATSAKFAAQGAIIGALMKIKHPEAPAMTEPRNLPFRFAEPEKAATASSQEAKKWSGMSHAFAGMAVQGLLFWSIEAAMGILRERKLGIWRRLRAAPVGAGTILLARILSGAIRALSILVVVFGAGALLFQMRINGSLIGFGLVALAAAFMAATFGLFVAALGRTEQQSRGLSVLAVLAMMMLGGAWFPAFLMPGWVQTISLAVPVRWAVDGFDAMLWRAQGLDQALPMVGVLTAFSVVFALVALKRMRWEYEA